MSGKITLEDFVTSWISSHLQPQKRQEIKEREMSEWKLAQGVRTEIIRNGLLEKYTSESGQEVCVDDMTIKSLAEEVAQRIVRLCQTKKPS